eukprot:TRINITY_DN33127_c0_g1_i1.p2 TRINITY_DN33127_c0_g1~~TRINITY_DN33127_c0_g1_i1.p2  ORF type:complete len:458 (+),score=120.79 TRINITY_DN33127_c0_g1_i1:191-1375(+)
MDYATSHNSNARRGKPVSVPLKPTKPEPGEPDAAVSRWLTNLGLSKYAGVFASHEFDMSAVAGLTENDLNQMGITAVGARRRLLNAAHAKGHADSGQPEPRLLRGQQQPPPEDGDDFFGITLPRSPAIERVHIGRDVDVGYPLSSVDPDHPPPEYAYGSNPAFRYPERNDRLFVTVSTKPRVLYFPRIITDEEADKIKALSEARVARSAVAITEAQRLRNESAVQDIRTSRQTWVPMTETPYLSRIEQRVQAIINQTWHEPLQVLNYAQGQHYDAHNDYFDPTMYGRQTENRFATFFIYLTDVEEGGHTSLPRAGGGPIPRDWNEKACGAQPGRYGVRSYPRKGAAVLFYSMRPDRSLDPYSLHAGCAPVRGNKWSGNLWFRVSTPPGTGDSHE